MVPHLPPTVSSSSQPSVVPQSLAIFVAIPGVVVSTLFHVVDVIHTPSSPRTKDISVPSRMRNVLNSALVTIGISIAAVFCVTSRRQRQPTDVHLLTSPGDERQWHQELRPRPQDSPQSEAPFSYRQSPARSSVGEVSAKRPESPIEWASTHSTPIRINSPAASIAASPSPPLPQAETKAQLSECRNVEARPEGEEPFAKPVVTTLPTARIVSTRGNRPSQTEQLGSASSSTCDIGR